MTDQADKRGDATRQQILVAAAQQFADKPYSQVNLDDVLEGARVTKGAMYFHFGSKLDLATAVVHHRADIAGAAFDAAFFQSLPGLEAMIEVCYRIGLQDVGEPVARAGFNLLEALGRFSGLQAELTGRWVSSFGDLMRRAVDDGDVRADVDPEQGARLVVSLYLGLRQTSDLDDPKTFFCDLEMALAMAIAGFARPDRLGYLTEFIQRRTALAIKNAAPYRAREL